MQSFFELVLIGLWFRGYELPRQEIAFGSTAWLANGLMFAFTHIWQPWNLRWILLTSLVGAYIVQRRKNTWIMIDAQVLVNAVTLVVLILNAFGTDVYGADIGGMSGSIGWFSLIICACQNHYCGRN